MVLPAPAPNLVLLAVVGRIKLLTERRSLTPPPAASAGAGPAKRAVIFAAALFRRLPETAGDWDRCVAADDDGSADDVRPAAAVTDGSRRTAGALLRDVIVAVDTNGRRTTCVAPMLEPLELLRLAGIRDAVAPLLGWCWLWWRPLRLGEAGADADINDDNDRVAAADVAADAEPRSPPPNIVVCSGRLYMDFSRAERWAATFLTVTADTALFSEERDDLRLVRLPLRSTSTTLVGVTAAAAAAVVFECRPAVGI